MHDAATVSAVQGPGDLRHDACNVHGLEPSLAQKKLGQVFAFEQFHGDVRHAFGHAKVEDLHHVRRAKGRGGAGFTLETTDVFVLVGQPGVEHFDGERSADLQVDRLPNARLSPSSKLAYQAVFPRDDLTASHVIL